MNRRSCLQMMSGAATSISTNPRANAQSSNSARPGNALPHIVIFNPDQFRAEAPGHLGNPAAVTPNLDRMV